MRVHLSIDVSNVPDSVSFYKKVFEVEPQKQTSNYAKFDLKRPAFNFAMQSSPDKSPSRVSHLGLEVESVEEVDAWRDRLEKLGLATRPEENVACCYARQDKFWFKDPDGNEWEVFVVHEQLPLVQENALAKGSDCCIPKETKSEGESGCAPEEKVDAAEKKAGCCG